MDEGSKRLQHEIAHGRWLAQREPETIWGWGSRAGRLRAQRRARWLIQAVELGPGMHALEVGCGTGLFTEMFAQSGAAITALDVSPDLLELARRREGLRNGVEFICSSVEAYSPESRFDVVIGSSILHHLELPSALESIRDVLRDDGSVAFAEPNGLNPQIFLQKRVNWLKRKAGDVSTETSFSRWSIGKIMARCGFRDVTVTPRDWLHPATPDGLIPPLLRLQELLERIPLVRELAGSLYLFARKGSQLAE